MRNLPLLVAALCTAACADRQAPVLERVEIGVPGMKIAIDGRGQGRFERNALARESGEGSFRLSSGQYARLVDRLEPFRRGQDAVSGQEMVARLNAPCEGEYITDRGAIYLHWVGPNLDRYYGIDLGCEPERNAKRNAELRAIVKSLPVPGA